MVILLKNIWIKIDFKDLIVLFNQLMFNLILVLLQ